MLFWQTSMQGKKLTDLGAELHPCQCCGIPNVLRFNFCAPCDNVLALTQLSCYASGKPPSVKDLGHVRDLINRLKNELANKENKDSFHQERWTTIFEWSDNTKWKKGYWYPIPLDAANEINCDDGIFNGYKIFKLEDKPANWDKFATTLAFDGTFSFIKALEICEAHNGKQLIKRLI